MAQFSDVAIELGHAHPGSHGQLGFDVIGNAHDLTGVAPLIAGLGLPFLTADLMVRADGRWRVVEIGDGQVSDYPSSAPAALLTALNARHGR